jgi:uncharacterized protein YacL
MQFTNISKASNLADYVPIITSSVIVDLIVIFITMKYASSIYLKKWYRTYNLGAVLADVLSVVIGIMIARYIYYYIFDEWCLWKFLLVVLGVQITHDILFYMIFSAIPRGSSSIMDLFKDYAKELKGFAIFGDSLIMIGTVLLASFLAGLDLGTNLFILLWVVYLVPYFVYSI